jgi:hypothetical protein
MSLKYSKLLNSEVDWSDDEILAGKKYIKWEELTIKWEDIDLTWDELFILLEVEGIIKGGGGYGYKEYVDGNPWKQVKKEIGEEKTKKIIKLYCRINGIDYQKYAVINENIKVTVRDFELFVRETVEKKISIKISDIKF